MLTIDEYLKTASHIPIMWLPKAEFSRRVGMPITTIDSKIRDGKWKEGEVIIHDPDGKVHISLVGYQRWIESAWREAQEKEAQSQSIAVSSTYNSTGTTQKKVQQNPTAGRSPQVKRRLKAIR